jgi:large subunit ribosomal protein L4
MEARKYKNNGQEIGKVTLPDNLFNAKINRAVLYEVIKLYLANQHQRTASTKERSEVHGSTRKLYRQKGTGRARAGSKKSPIRVGGGVVFGPKPKDQYKKIPKKKKRIALISALSTRRENVSIIEDFGIESASTRYGAEILKNMDIKYKRCLVVLPDNSLAVIRSFSNLPNVTTMRAQDLCAFEVLRASTLIITEKALETVKETFK